jgi:hypothetical protein
VQISNNGPLIVETDYWGGEINRAGGFVLSPNAGTLRLLVPSGWEADFLRDTHGAREVIVSRGPWPEHRVEGIELLWEDGSPDPYCLHLDARQCVPLIASTDDGREIPVAIWVKRRGKPHLAREYPGRFRMVPQVPWLKKWGEMPRVYSGIRNHGNGDDAHEPPFV